MHAFKTKAQKSLEEIPTKEITGSQVAKFNGVKISRKESKCIFTKAQSTL